MVIQRLALILLAYSSCFCTDLGLQTGVGDKVVSEEHFSSDGNDRNVDTSVYPGKVREGTSVTMDLDDSGGRSLEASSVSAPAPLVSTTGYGVCDHKTPSCGPSLIVHFPMDSSFQEGSGGPTEPLEVHGLLEFFQASDCLGSYVRRTRDLRASFRSGCIEVEQGVASVKDGGTISLSLGNYYVRVRGYDGAPYTHFLLAHKEGSDGKELFIEHLDSYDAEGNPLSPSALMPNALETP